MVWVRHINLAKWKGQDRITIQKEWVRVLKTVPAKWLLFYSVDTQDSTICKLELWVTSLSDTPRLQYYDV
jgi:hypothetical protein